MSSTRKTFIIGAALLVISLIISGCTPPPHCSADFLIWSINQANNNGPGTDTIELAAGCTYELDYVDNNVDGHNGTPTITSSIIINGNGAMVVRYKGDHVAPEIGGCRVAVHE